MKENWWHEANDPCDSFYSHLAYAHISWNLSAAAICKTQSVEIKSLMNTNSTFSALMRWNTSCHFVIFITMEQSYEKLDTWYAYLLRFYLLHQCYSMTVMHGTWTISFLINPKPSSLWNEKKGSPSSWSFWTRRHVDLKRSAQMVPQERPRKYRVTCHSLLKYNPFFRIVAVTVLQEVEHPSAHLERKGELSGQEINPSGTDASPSPPPPDSLASLQPLRTGFGAVSLLGCLSE